MKKDFSFKILKKDNKSKARVGEITTAHGVIKTPAFVPVGTKATVKGLTPQDLKEAEVQILFGNTYHLHLRPGEDLVREFGGLSKFMSWNGPTITDSGGFQVFSLGKIVRLSHVSDELFGVLSKVIPSASARSIFSGKPSAGELRAVGSPSSFATPPKEEIKLVKITDDGVEFRSHIDGSKHLFTPEISVEIQKKLGADLILVFDECAPHPSSHEYAREAMERTHKWAIRSLAAFKSKIQSTKSETNSKIKNPNNKKVSNLEFSNSYFPWSQGLYGIIQGGVYKDLREESAKFISKLDFDGIAIGGYLLEKVKKK